ncbi:hypothetical protein GCM10025868_41780 [Angustibacter aerolatus]|uniref:Flagellar motor switch protein FliN-like C-terminal domain-containing protein n=1 Tax=Angustibacter aerolatus TaxID=1162965 RepID=A0ABQ6JLP9_9ACTN|nr:hypothetical protein GCM10025868_41780 [Angustibacter aerolatus]
MQEAAATDLYIVASLSVTLAGTQQAATVALPAPVLAPRASESQAPDAKERAARQANRVAMSTLVEDVPVEVRVRFVPRPMRSAALLTLKVGDVVRLDHPTDRPLDVVSSGVVCARGVAGTNGPRAACLITSSTLPGRASE